MVLRYSAFTDTPEGGNPAGVVLDASTLTDEQMQQIAKDVNYSESAFVTQREDQGEYDVRYFSPEAEVPFCGHATIATAVALAERDGAGPLVFHTQAGVVDDRDDAHDRHPDERHARTSRTSRKACSTRPSRTSTGTPTTSTPSSRRRSASPAPATSSWPRPPANASPTSTTTSRPSRP